MLAILELLSRHATERLSLARIVREVDISRATAHAVLAQLTAQGWTVRDEDGCYGIGRRLLVVARRAEVAYPVRHVALPHLRALAKMVGAPAFLAEREGDAIVVTEMVGEPSASWLRVGRRLPVAPPFAREFVAWSSPAAQRDWLDEADELVRPRLTEVLTTIRDRGYSVERLVGDSGTMLEVLARLDNSTVTAPLRSQLGSAIADLITIDYLPDELTDDNPVVTVAAPVRDATGTVIAALVVCPDTRLTADALTAVGTNTSTAAATVTADLVDGPHGVGKGAQPESRT
ncbi:hypothetical protein GCM10011591_03450 [Nocardia camponoti]|uniref:Helix-turn-helix domain-containing protein n=1 Tax=Nocardia camponoti TaxID=1616106 RepID=A0A917V4C3_9NOCA|nr:hypothetical protein GCM10011591_03450 [Nocardia camponoti]